MSDTQWPRYFVFKQDADDEPHLNCGTIHAPDPEMALQNARDVFVRRPECVSLWVVPARDVLGRTAEELERDAPAPADGDGEREPYAVFLKPSHRDQHAYAGDVEAGSAEDALARVLETWPERDAVAYWVAARSSLRVSDLEDAGAWFGPAYDKPYRHASFYRTESLMREIKAEHEQRKARP